ncbi:hypothetical protein LENED_008709 [Lentinula edodes]|uniref:Uncharacterized protein n=1 Tax=Lentinula edodes TaxID=5353 RepID=A0A1Q3EHS0_LENED|nr:hypothetical protein LENED_008709 [Lentinula edodes]
MAALYLHNAIFTPEPSDSNSQRSFAHSRTISSTTLRTTTTDYSHPTEPLLQSTNSGSLAYQDLLSRQPGYQDEESEQWTAELSPDNLPPTYKEGQDYREHSVRRRLRILKRSRLVLKAVLALWAVYNTVRYFIAYTIYDSLQGQTTAIVLGTSTAVCFAFLICAAAVSAFQPHLIRAHIPIHSLLVMRAVFRYLAAFFLVSPAIVNLALTVVWRSSSVSELIPELRCRLDVDVVWSINTRICNRTTLAGWLGLSIFRLIFTLIVVILFLLVSSAYDGTRRPSQSSQRRKRQRRRVRSDQSLHKSPPISASSEVPLNPAQPRRQSPHSPAVSYSEGYNRTAFGSSGTSSIFNSSSSEDDEISDSTRFDPVHMQPRSTLSSTSTPSTQNDRELNNFAERFRALVSQISHEADEALRFAQLDDTGELEPALLPGNTYTDLPRHAYDEFVGGEYPPDDHHWKDLRFPGSAYAKLGTVPFFPHVGAFLISLNFVEASSLIILTTGHDTRTPRILLRLMSAYKCKITEIRRLNAQSSQKPAKHIEFVLFRNHSDRVLHMQRSVLHWVYTAKLQRT